MLETQNGSATLEDRLAVSYKSHHTFTIESSKRAPCYLSKGTENLCSQKNLCTHVDSSFIQTAETQSQPGDLQQVNGVNSSGKVRQWNISECQKEVNYKAMIQNGGNLNAYY